MPFLYLFPSRISYILFANMRTIEKTTDPNLQFSNMKDYM